MHLPGALIEAGFGDHFAQHLPVEPDGVRLLGRDRTADLPAQLLHAVVVDVAEFFDGNFDAADFGDRRAAKAAKNVVDAPNREAERQKPHDHTHDGSAEPIGGGVADTSEHVQRSRVRPLRRKLSRYRRSALAFFRGRRAIFGGRIIGSQHANPQPAGIPAKSPFSVCKASANARCRRLSPFR